MTRLQAKWIGERGGRRVVVAVYEDSATGERVKEFYRGLARDLGGDSHLIKHLWLINLLRLPRLRAVAAEDAASADLVILSFHGAESFPEEIKQWMEMWLPRKGNRQVVLAAFFDHTYGKDHQALHEYLESAASRGGMEFFVQSWDSLES